MRRPADLVIAVLVTCVVAASGLALTYAATSERIAEQDRRAEERSLAAAFPGADAFEPVTDAAALEAAAEAAGTVEVRGVYRASVSGQHAGWAVKVASRGYGGPIQLVIGLDRDGKVTGVSILAMSETPGLGTKVQSEAWFLEQFKGLPPAFTDADVRGLDAISGSTRSSTGVRNGVAAAGRVFNEVLRSLQEGAR